VIEFKSVKVSRPLDQAFDGPWFGMQAPEADTSKTRRSLFFLQVNVSGRLSFILQGLDGGEFWFYR
jgi:hypothetical protein